MTASKKNESVKPLKDPDEEDLERKVSTKHTKKIVYEELKKIECEYSKGKEYSGELFFCEHCSISTISL